MIKAGTNAVNPASRRSRTPPHPGAYPHDSLVTLRAGSVTGLTAPVPAMVGWGPRGWRSLRGSGARPGSTGCVSRRVGLPPSHLQTPTRDQRPTLVPQNNEKQPMTTPTRHPSDICKAPGHGLHQELARTAGNSPCAPEGWGFESLRARQNPRSGVLHASQRDRCPDGVQHSYKAPGAGTTVPITPLQGLFFRASKAALRHASSLSATSSRRSGNKCPYTLRVIEASACPSMDWTTFTSAPAAMAKEAELGVRHEPIQSSHRGCGTIAAWAQPRMRRNRTPARRGSRPGRRSSRRRWLRCSAGGPTRLIGSCPGELIRDFPACGGRR